MAPSLRRAVGRIRRLTEHGHSLLDISRGHPVDQHNLEQLALAVAALQHSESASVEPVRSCLCTQRRCTGADFTAWCHRLDIVPMFHRWTWEKVHIARTLHEWGVIGAGQRGLGFGVGGEPLVAWFASQGCDVVATDLPAGDERAGDWLIRDRAPGTLAALQRPTVCDPETFAARVQLRAVDMNDVPADLADFDFCWSACALEHLGSLDVGMRFVERSLKCLRPGGVAVHTTEFNVSSTGNTITSGPTVLYRRDDIEQLVSRLQRAGHDVAPLDFDAGAGILDQFVVDAGANREPMLRVAARDQYVTTTFAIAIRIAA